MRNGVYRVWLKTQHTEWVSAALLDGDDIIACDDTFGFVGRYQVRNGRFTGDLLCKRLNLIGGDHVLPEGDFHLSLEGSAGEDFAVVTGKIHEAPELEFTQEYAWMGECDAQRRL